MKWITRLFLLFVACTASAVATARPAALPVLIVVSSHGADGGKTRPGFEMDELSQAWVLLRQNNVAVEIASPMGGVPVADKYDAKKPYVAAFLADTEAQRQLGATRTIASVKHRDYAAVYVMGGKGAMFDLIDHADLQALLRDTHAEGRVVAAVCHGPAAFTKVMMRDGRPLIAGRAMTGFSDAEEKLFGKKWVAQFPFLLESELRQRGARVTVASMMLPHVVTDGRIVTGQNPYSTAATTDAVVRALGREPAPRTLWADERSIALVAGLTPETMPQAKAVLAANPMDYDIPLIAIWGFYRGGADADRDALVHALGAMELAAPHYEEPQLKAAIVEAKARLAAMPPQ